MPARDPIASLAALARALPAWGERAWALTRRGALAQGPRTTAFHNRTGRLRASIRAGVIERSVAHVVGALTAGAQDAAPGRGPEWATPSWDYAPIVELGTGRSSPRPYIWTTMVQMTAQDTLRRAMQAEFRSWRP